MDVSQLEVECEKDGCSCVKVWAKCKTPEDIDDIISWLKLAKSFMIGWNNVRNAKTSHAPKAEASKDETVKRREVQHSSQVEVRADGKHSLEKAQVKSD